MRKHKRLQLVHDANDSKLDQSSNIMKATKKVKCWTCKNDITVKASFIAPDQFTCGECDKPWTPDQK